MTEFSVNYAALDGASEAIKASSQSIMNRMNDLNSKFKQIAWEGAHQANYLQTQQKLEQSVTTMNELLAKMGQLVMSARELYANTEQRQAGVWS
jgi:WXG100 family type VII secretion target